MCERCKAMLDAMQELYRCDERWLRWCAGVQQALAETRAALATLDLHSSVIESVGVPPDAETTVAWNRGSMLLADMRDALVKAEALQGDDDEK